MLKAFWCLCIYSVNDIMDFVYVYYGSKSWMIGARTCSLCLYHGPPAYNHPSRGGTRTQSFLSCYVWFCLPVCHTRSSSVIYVVWISMPPASPRANERWMELRVSQAKQVFPEPHVIFLRLDLIFFFFFFLLRNRDFIYTLHTHIPGNITVL